ncbi:hypothetical protein BZG36_05392 [Bifiguratus adelaidae]|uniref:3'-5' exonuclease domain-containing protein n=1 Tax=Bifiguratus adelaidae TaxID=1938954 RepID=A0A261XTH8_9FUNG|nr:hypothetical protein BZG36_05392 [Bifiguratus adelaidae]
MPKEIRKKLVVVGDGGCGKTSLLVVFQNGTFPDKYVPTVFENYIAEVRVDNKVVELALWDTAGQEDYDRLRPLSYPETNVILICFAIDQSASFDNVQDRWVPEVTHFCPNVPKLLVGMKVDLREERDRIAELHSIGHQLISYEEGEALAREIGAKYYECSAKAEYNVKEVIEAAVRASMSSSLKRITKNLILAHVNGTDSDLGFDYNLARIVIKELIEFGDMPSARDFEMIWRTRFGPTDIVGLILRHKMEIPRAIIRGPPKEANLNPNTYRLPQGVKIKRVYDGKSLQKMVQALMDAEIVGMDTEWRPKFVAGDGQTERTALFQFACYPLDRVYLVDMLAFNKQSRRERLMDAITSLLEDEDILKIGFDFRSDQRTLQKTYPELGADAVEIDNYVDLRSEKDEMARKANIKISGLSGFVSAVLGKTLDKKQQMSDWERRPLSAEQECYAAADAYCLIELYRKLYH